MSMPMQQPPQPQPDPEPTEAQLAEYDAELLAVNVGIVFTIRRDGLPIGTMQAPYKGISARDWIRKYDEDLTGYIETTARDDAIRQACVNDLREAAEDAKKERSQEKLDRAAYRRYVRECKRQKVTPMSFEEYTTVPVVDGLVAEMDADTDFDNATEAAEEKEPAEA